LSWFQINQSKLKRLVFAQDLHVIIVALCYSVRTKKWPSAQLWKNVQLQINPPIG